MTILHIIPINANMRTMVKGIERRVKAYVEVTARHLADGTVLPISIKWEDGTTYVIEKVLNKRRAESLKVGGFGMRYLVRVKGRDTFLYYEGPRWFVEKKVYNDGSYRTVNDANSSCEQFGERS